MLLANEAVGGMLARAKRPALYRVHEHPKHEAILQLVDRLTALGLPVAPLPERADGPEAARWVASQAELLEPIIRERPATREPFAALLLRTLQKARYDPVNTGHSALASPAYVHFTSPIRRYPDIVVHRAACALAGLGEEAPEGTGPAGHRAALLAGRARGGRCRAARRGHLSGVPAAGPAAPRRLASELRGRRHGAHRRRAVRTLRRRLRGLPARLVASTRASASTATSTASRSSAAARGEGSSSATRSPWW